MRSLALPVFASAPSTAAPVWSRHGIRIAPFREEGVWPCQPLIHGHTEAAAASPISVGADSYVCPCRPHEGGPIRYVQGSRQSLPHRNDMKDSASMTTVPETFPFYRFEGTHFEIGRQFGEACAD